MRPLSQWFRRTFSDPQVVLLVALLLGAVLAIAFFAEALSPVIAAVVIAFLLDGPTEWLRRQGLSNLLASSAVFLGFLAILGITFFIILPPLTGQVTQFFELLPNMLGRLREALLKLPEAYPGIVSEAFVRDLIDSTASELSLMGREVVTRALTGVTSAITTAVYLILVSVMLFFFLKDKRQIMNWLSGFLPEERPMTDRIWREVTQRAGDYARGKVYEIVIVGTAAWITFQVIDLRFPALLAALTGLSVVVPYIGAAVITLPVAFVAFFEWGLGTEFFIAVGAYLILQALDGNVLAPLLFSEVVKLHPNAIILAVLIFGSIWGVWGVFFAIPLATLVHSVIKAWPRRRLAREPAEETRSAAE